MGKPGLMAFMGSGETSYNGGKIFESLARHLHAPLNISLLETPAGFELNSDRVVGRVADYLRVRLQNDHPDIHVIPARKKGTAFSPDSAEIIRPMASSNLIFLGPGSPTYAVRQLEGSLAWDVIQARQRAGAVLVMASAATVAAGAFALPVYEIYKVGEEPHWKPGLDLFAAYGLKMVVIPHWNNEEGGSELDTSRCFIGQERFNLLAEQLPPDSTILGLDEHTAVVMDFAEGVATVKGRSCVHIIRQRVEQSFSNGVHFPLTHLGNFRLPTVEEGISMAALDLIQQVQSEKPDAEQTPQEVVDLLGQRQNARERKDWLRADEVRAQIAALGWKIMDTPDGPMVEKNHEQT